MLRKRRLDYVLVDARFFETMELEGFVNGVRIRYD